MLRIGSQRAIGALSCFSDDTAWHRFYLVASRPRLRRDDAGEPVVWLARYAFDDDARARDDSLPHGGGRCWFDVELAPSPGDVEAARSELQAVVDAEHARRRAAGERVSAAPPAVELLTPSWCGGEIELELPRADGSLTRVRRPAAVLAGSVAVFDLDLDAADVALVRAFVFGGGASGAPAGAGLRVRYDLRLWGRLPAVTIRVEGETRRIHETLRGLELDRPGRAWQPSELAALRRGGFEARSLVTQGSVRVTIDRLDDATDDATNDATIEALRAEALAAFDELLERRLLEAIDDAPVTTPGGYVPRDPAWVALVHEREGFAGRVHELTEHAAAQPAAIGSVFVRPGHRVGLFAQPAFRGDTRWLARSDAAVAGSWRWPAGSLRVFRPPLARRVRRRIDEVEASLVLELEASRMVQWPVVAQGDLAAELATLSPERRAAHVVDLTPSTFGELSVDVRVHARFGPGALAAVEVELEYAGVDDSGAPQHKAQSWTFTAAEPAPRRWSPSAIGRERSYAYRWRVIRADGVASPSSPWTRSRSQQLDLAIADPGRVDIDVTAVAIDWTVVREVSVALRHDDPGATEPATEPAAETVLVLDREAPARRWVVELPRPLAGELEARPSYALVDGGARELAPVRVGAGAPELFVPRPPIDRLELSLLPAGAWDDVQRAVVIVEPESPAGATREHFVELRRYDELGRLRVALADPARRGFRWRHVIVHRDGRTEEGPWRAGGEDRVLAITPADPPRLRVAVWAQLVDFTTTPVVTVELRHAGASAVLSFIEPTAQVWTSPATAPDELEFEIVWYTADGRALTSGVTRTRERELVIPAVASVAGRLDLTVLGTAIDYDATPSVELELRTPGSAAPELAVFDREHRVRRFLATLPPAMLAEYSYAVIYTRADGTRAPGPGGSGKAPVLFIPPLAT